MVIVFFFISNDIVQPFNIILLCPYWNLHYTKLTYRYNLNFLYWPKVKFWTGYLVLTEKCPCSVSKVCLIWKAAVSVVLCVCNIDIFHRSVGRLRAYNNTILLIKKPPNPIHWGGSILTGGGPYGPPKYIFTYLAPLLSKLSTYTFWL